MKDLIIGASTGYTWDTLKYWVNSINQSGFDGDISFFGVSPWKEMSESREEEEGERWYVSMCSRTLGEKSWGVYDSGVVSSSGFGDGSYSLYVAKKRGKIVAMCVDFQVEEEGIIDFDFFRDIQLEK